MAAGSSNFADAKTSQDSTLSTPLNMQTRTIDAKGVYTICPTPFETAGELDLDSLRSLIDFQLDAGIHGLAILGFLGEAHKLSSFERRRVIETAVAHARGKVPIWVGVRALGTAGSIEQAQIAEGLGADAVFVAPLDNGSDAMLFEYYRKLAESVKIPVIIHDFPDSFGTEIRAELVARLSKEANVSMIKMEEPPVGPKISRIQELAGDSIKIFGGLGGVYFLEELERGAVGTMTGFAFPEILLRIYKLFSESKLEQATQVFDHYCPLIRYEFQPKIGLALRKYTYMRRGIISTDTIRSPGTLIDDITKQELARVITRVGLSLNARGVQEVI